MRRALPLALGVLLAAPGIAHAGTASLIGVGPGGGQPFGVAYVAAPGERNVVSAVVTGGEVRITDVGAPAMPGVNCVADAPDTVRCPLPAGTSSLVVRLQGGDGDDALRVEPLQSPAAWSVATVLDGGEGNDRLVAASVSDAQAGRTATNPTRAYLAGGPGDDVLADGAGDALLAGGDGRDQLLGGPGDDTLMGDATYGQELAPAPVDVASPIVLTPPAPAQPDQLDGGPGEDVADYSDRPEPVRVDLTASSPDGVVGEGDVLTGMDGAAGGPGGATLRGDANANVLIGHAAGTTLDRLTGEAGDDTLISAGRRAIEKGNAGDDVLVGPDPASSCGEGADDRVRPGLVPVLDGVRLGDDCEALALGPADGLLVGLGPLRHSGGDLTLAAATLPQTPRATRATLTLKRSGKTYASGTHTLPRPLRTGARATLRARLTTAAKKQLASVSSLEATIAVPGTGGGRARVLLPLAR